MGRHRTVLSIERSCRGVSPKVTWRAQIAPDGEPGGVGARYPPPFLLQTPFLCFPLPGRASGSTGNAVDAAPNPRRIVEPRRAVSLALRGAQRCAAATLRAQDPALPEISRAEGERCGCISASQNRKPSCLRAHVIRSHIMGPCSRCQKRPPVPRGPEHQVLLLNRPLWRTRSPEVPGALSRRDLWKRPAVSRLGPWGYFPVRPAISCGW